MPLKRMIRKITAITLMIVLTSTMLTMFLPATVTKADVIASGTCGDRLTWSFDSNGTLTISGTGTMYDYSGEVDEDWNLIDITPWKDYYDKITRVVVENGVTSIGGYAFVLRNLRSVSLPKTLTRIDHGAFDGCSELMELVLPSSVTSIGEFAFQGCSNLTSFTIPSGVKTLEEGVFYGCASLPEIVIPSGVTSIGNNAFYCCEGLKSVTIPSTVKTIGDQAFYGCHTLLSITIPQSVTTIGEEAFLECDLLSSIDIPSGVTSIGDRAFEYCENLEEINIASGNSAYASEDGVLFNKDKTELICYPAGKYGDYTVPSTVTAIVDQAFAQHHNLTGITLNSNCTEISGYMFGDCTNLERVTIPSSVTSIGYSAFYNCPKLTEISLPSSIRSIEDSAFAECTSLTSITIPNRLSKIAGYTFYGCSSLSEVNFQSTSQFFRGVTTIESGAFGSCTSLTSITLPAYLSNLSGEAFSGCSSLTEINFASGARYYSSQDGVVFNTGKTTLVCCPSGKIGSYTVPSSVTVIGDCAFVQCALLEEIILPEGLTEIGDSAFRGCLELKEIHIPEGVTTIGRDVFTCCYALEEITLPAGITVIPESAFFYCTALKSVKLPDGVTSIGDCAFQSCSSLEEINIPDGVEYIGMYAFASCSSLEEIYIPASVTEIDPSAFENCSAQLILDPANTEYVIVDDVVFNKQMTELIRCSGSKTGYYTIPSSVTSINRSAFIYCANLNGITIPEGIDTLTYGMFEGCSSLEYVTLPASISIIESRVFAGCYSLKRIDVASDNPYYISVDGVLFNLTMTNLVKYPCGRKGSYVIPDGVEVLSENSFSDAIYLTDITMPDSLGSIGDSAFSGCTNLKSVKIPDSVYSVGFLAFNSCCSLQSAIISENVKNVAAYAFNDCVNLQHINIPASTRNIGNKAFKNCPALTDIYYNGDGDSWYTISAGQEMDYSYLFLPDNLDPAMDVQIVTEAVPGGVAVTMNSASDSVFYTLDGSEPGTASIPYEGTFFLDEAGEFFINARAYNLDEVSFSNICTEYVSVGQSVQPRISERGRQIIMSADGDIYYTLDITQEPSLADHRYEGPLSFSETTVLKARTIELGKALSPVVNYTYYTEQSTALTYPDESYSFRNEKASFGYFGFIYRISQQMYKDTFGDAMGQFLFDLYGADAWGGSCFGMSSTALMFHSGFLSIGDYSDEAKSVYELLAPASGESRLTQLIEKYQISQFLPTIMEERGDVTEGGNMVISGLSGNEEAAAALLDSIRSGLNGGDPVILIIWRQDLAGSHAVVPYKIDENKIYIYDCNKPGEDNYISYKINGTGSYSFTYGEYSYAVSFNRMSTLLEGLENIDTSALLMEDKDGTSQLMVALNTDNFRIFDEKGSEISEYLTCRTTEDMGTEQTVIYLDEGTYRIVNQDENAESFRVSAANDKDYCSIESADPSATIMIGKEYDKLSLKVKSEDAAEIAFSAVNASGETSQISMKAADGRFYSSTDNAYLFSTDAKSANINGTDMELEQDRNHSNLCAGAVSVKATAAANRYETISNNSISTDISELPEDSFVISVMLNGADGASTLYAVSYNEAGKMIDVRSAKTVEGQKTYVFTIRENADKVKIMLLDGQLRPLTNSAEIK